MRLSRAKALVVRPPTVQSIDELVLAGEVAVSGFNPDGVLANNSAVGVAQILAP